MFFLTANCVVYWDSQKTEIMMCVDLIHGFFAPFSVIGIISLCNISAPCENRDMLRLEREHLSPHVN